MNEFGNVKIEFLESLVHISKLDELQCFVLDFFASKFKLSNCVVRFHALKKYKVVNYVLEHIYSYVENKLFSHLAISRSIFTTQCLANDIMFKDIAGIAQLPQSVVALPLLSGGEFVGCVVCYSDKDFCSELELLSWLCSRLCSVLERISVFSAVEHSALTDSLTGLYNRVYFEAVGDNCIMKARKECRPTSIVLLDIDDFKLFNDNNGHLAGDALLKELGTVLKNVCAEFVACRFGGEEFIVFLPDTKSERALEFSERIRTAVSGSLGITVSLGVVSCLNSSVDLVAMFKEADLALYKAKDAGKNKSCLRVIVDKSLSVIDAEEAGSVGKS